MYSIVKIKLGGRAMKCRTKIVHTTETGEQIHGEFYTCRGRNQFIWNFPGAIDRRKIKRLTRHVGAKLYKVCAVEGSPEYTANHKLSVSTCIVSEPGIHKSYRKSDGTFCKYIMVRDEIPNPMNFKMHLSDYGICPRCYNANLLFETKEGAERYIAFLESLVDNTSFMLSMIKPFNIYIDYSTIPYRNLQTPTTDSTHFVNFTKLYNFDHLFKYMKYNGNECPDYKMDIIDE